MEGCWGGGGKGEREPNLGKRLQKLVVVDIDLIFDERDILGGEVWSGRVICFDGAFCFFREVLWRKRWCVRVGV